MYKQDLVLNNLQWLICHKTKPNLLRNYISLVISQTDKRSPCDIMANILDCNVVINKFELQLFTFGPMPLGKVCTLLIPPAMG